MMNSYNEINDSFLSENNIGKFSHFAMNTTFKFFIQNEDFSYAEQASHEAFRIIDLLEDELSKFLPNSEISRINSSPINQHIILSEDAFYCLMNCKNLFEITCGKFNITAGEKISKQKNKESINNNYHSDKNIFPVEFDEPSFTILKTKEIEIDLGGYGKGYALDKVQEMFSEWGLHSFLLSGGYSTLLAKNSDDGLTSWPLSITIPGSSEALIDKLYLRNYSLSGSGLVKGYHIIDPDTGQPVKRSGAWAACGEAGTSDALSTAFMIMDTDEIKFLCRTQGISALLLESPDEGGKIFKAGEFFNEYLDF